LRAVHFALVVIGITGIIISRSPDLSRLQTAQFQLKTIHDFVDYLKSATQPSADEDDSWITFTMGDAKYAARFPALLRIADGDCQQMPGRSRRSRIDELELNLVNIPRLSGFERFWDAINCSSVKAYAPRIEYFARPDEPFSFRRACDPAEPPEIVGGTSLNVLNEPKSLIIKSNMALATFEPDIASSESRISFGKIRPTYTSIEPETCMPQASMEIGYMLVKTRWDIASWVKTTQGHSYLEEAESTWTCKQSFDECFKELKQFSRDKESYTLKDLMSFFDDQLARNQPKQFEIFGVKFPFEDQARWGIFLILGVFCYYWLHLRELSPRIQPDDAGVDVAWIGLYPSVSASAVTFISVVIIPVAAVFLLGTSGSRYSGSMVGFVRNDLKHFMEWIFLPALGCLVLSAMSFASMRRLAKLAARQSVIADSSQRAEKQAAV
jgi:hypothetical protein